MKRLFLLLTLLLCGVAHATTDIRVLFVYTQAGIDKTASMYSSGTPNWGIETSLITEKMNATFQTNGMDVTFTSAGVRTDIPCCGTSAGTGDAIMFGIDSYPIMKARDDAVGGADVVIIVGQWNNDPANGFAFTCATPAVAVIAINANVASGTTASHEMAHIFCAKHNKGVQIKSGSKIDDCKVNYSLMLDEIDALFPTSVWTVIEGGLYSATTYQNITGQGSTPDLANTAMSANCSAASSGYWVYSCAPAGCSGGTCAHSRTSLFTPSGWSSSPVLQMPATETKGYFQCPNLVPIPYFEGTAVYWNGVPIGDANHDNVSVMKARIPLVGTYRYSKVSPGIPH